MPSDNSAGNVTVPLSPGFKDMLVLFPVAASVNVYFSFHGVSFFTLQTTLVYCPGWIEVPIPTALASLQDTVMHGVAFPPGATRLDPPRAIVLLSCAHTFTA